jgi:predicted Rossmann-fold nucleotide-binding protein
MSDHHRNPAASAVFCGSSAGTNPFYREVAGSLAEPSLSRRIELIYGGGGIGLMGAVWRMRPSPAGAEVTGVIPTGLASKGGGAFQPHRPARGQNDARAQGGDGRSGRRAFLALPGGMGTFDELFEILTWAQLGIHRKPIGLLNIDRYFDPLVAMVDHTVQEGFVSLTIVGWSSSPTRSMTGSADSRHYQAPSRSAPAGSGCRRGLTGQILANQIQAVLIRSDKNGGRLVGTFHMTDQP